MLLRRVANDARLDMYSACWRYGRNIHASPGLLATKVIINPSYNLEPVQTTSPKQASRELQFHPFSITREAPTTDLPSSFDIRFVRIYYLFLYIYTIETDLSGLYPVVPGDIYYLRKVCQN